MNSVNIFTQDSTWGIGTCPSIFVDPQILPVELSVMLLDVVDGFLLDVRLVDRLID